MHDRRTRSNVQHVQDSTCRTGNILDHILTPKEKNIVRNLAIHDVGLSDHSLITCKITEAIVRVPAVQSTFRCWKRLDIDQFRARIISSGLYVKPADTADTFADQLKTNITEILNDLLPEHVITRRAGKSRSSCLSEEAVKAKQERRKLERKWKSTGYEAVRIAYRKACKVANKLINKSRSTFYAQRVQDTSGDPRMLWKTVKSILHTSRTRCSQEGLCNAFASHIKEKIDRVRSLSHV